MILALDIGNSNVKAGLFEGGALRNCWRAPIQAAPRRMLAAWQREAGAVDRLILSTVVPPVADAWRAAAAELGLPALTVSGESPLMPVTYDPPETLGCDRLVAAFAARELYGAPVIVADLGTATTVDCVDAAGVFRGGAILCGIELARDALCERAAQLPWAHLDPPASALGTRTMAALDVGLVLGHVEAIAGLAARMRRESGAAEAPLIATGGLAELAEAAAPGLFAQLEPHLVLYGLHLASERLEAETRR